MEVWVIGWTRRDCRMFVNDERIILLSLCQPTLEFSFTLNRWMQFVASIRTIADIIRLNPYERKAIESRHHGLFRKHLGEGYYIVVMYHYTNLVLDFRQPCIASPTGRQTFSAIFPTRKGININLQDEWEYLLDEVILGIHHNYPKFAEVLQPRRECLYGDGDRCHLGRKGCTLCNPFVIKTDSITI